MKARRVPGLCRSGKESCGGGVRVVSCSVSSEFEQEINRRGHRGSRRGRGGPLRSSARKLRVLCGKSIRLESANFGGHLNFVTRVNPRLSPASNVQQIRETS